MTNKVLVIGGGIAGITAAMKLAESGKQVVLVEKTGQLGGNFGELAMTFPALGDAQALLTRETKAVKEQPGVEIIYNSELSKVSGKAGSFSVEISTGDKTKKLQVGAIILATGFNYFDPTIYTEYGYGRAKNVVTSLEFEKMVAAGKLSEGAPKVVFVHCVGSRDRSKGYRYCSKICCTYSAKHAIMLKQKNPKARGYVFYIDIRALGKGYEEFVRDAMESYGTRYIRGRVAKVIPSGEKLIVRAEDSLIGNPIEIEADYVVLASAMEPTKGSKEIAGILDIELDQYGFFKELEENTRPTHSTKPGIFLAGSCTQPMEIAQAVAQGGLAASEVMAMLAKE